MTLPILLTQVALPLALLAWLGLWPAGSVAGVSLQAAGTGAFLLALARVAQWAVPVWWLPWVYGGLWLLALATALLRGGTAGLPVLPDTLSGWATIALSVVLLGLGGWYGARAILGQRLPPGPSCARPAPAWWSPPRATGPISRCPSRTRSTGSATM